MPDVQLMISEEYVDNEPTGIEAETQPEIEPTGQGPRLPWDPTKIRVTPRNFSLRNIVDFVDDGTLELFPDFQRNKVWGPGQRSRLIESILLQIPLPAFYFVEERDLQLRVVDGLQRLSTIYDFMRGDSFKLTDLEFLADVEGQRFGELGLAAQRRINTSQITVNVVDPTTPNGVKFNIYKRINTGGSPLTLQEIRHCMADNRSRNFLKLLTHLSEFELAINSATLGKRMADRELALRFCAFAHGGYERYRGSKGMDEFLDEMSETLGNPAKITDAQLESLQESFRSALANCATVFGKHAFRKWPLRSTTVNPLNRTLFETWTYALRDVPTSAVRPRREKIALAAQDLMTNDQAYIQSITAATGDPNKLEYRFKAALRAVEAAL